MTDLTLTRSGELLITQAEGNTEAGIEFVDRYVGGEFFVVDAGRIILHSADIAALERHALGEGLTVEHQLVAAEQVGT